MPARKGAPDAHRLFFSRTYDFLEVYLPRQAGRSPDTVDCYRDGLTQFRRFARERLGKGVGELEFGDVGRDAALSFVEWMRGGGASAGTCNARLAALRSYLWYAADADVAVQSVALAVSRVPQAKGPSKVREALSPAALAAVLSAPDPSTLEGMRDRALLATLYDTGVRLSELVGLDVGDLVLSGPDPSALVTGKGNKQRAVALSDVTVGHLSQLVRVCHGDDPDPASPVFCVRRRGSWSRMSGGNVERIVRKHAAAAREACPEVPESVYPHMFRRTRGTDLYRAGVPIELVSALLGHASVDTTRVYAKASTEMLREAMGAAPSPAGPEEPLWVGDEEALARLCGLR